MNKGWASMNERVRKHAEASRSGSRTTTRK
jgi:hypothetical protein